MCVRISVSILILGVLLIAPSSFAETKVSGTITTQTWTKAESPYRVTTASVEIPATDTLSIEAGCTILFEPYTGIVTHGALIVEGTQTDSVRFAPVGKHQWSGISVSPTGTALVRYASVERANQAINAFQTTVSLIGVKFVRSQGANGAALYLRKGAKAYLDSCTISKSDQGAAVYATQSSKAILKNCTVEGNYRDGISSASGSYIEIDNCMIERNYTFGITCKTDGYISITNSRIIDNSVHSTGGAINIVQAGIAVVNTVIGVTDAAQAEGTAVRLNDGTATIRNSVIWTGDNYTSSIEINGDSKVKLQNCIIWGENDARIVDVSYGLEPTVIMEYCCAKGVLAGVGNLSIDPEFTAPDEGDYSLSTGSPCRGTGSPYIVNKDGSPSDMGVEGGFRSSRAPRIESSTKSLSMHRGETDTVHFRNIGISRLDLTASTSSSEFQILGPVNHRIFIGTTASIAVLYTGDTIKSGNLEINHTDPHQPPLMIELHGVAGAGISGPQTGVWTHADSPVFVSDSIYVPDGELLTIMPGVDVLFDAGARMVVRGRIEAIGTQDDSVRFISAGGDRWGGIYLDTADSSTFSFCRVSMAESTPESREGGGGMCVDSGKVKVANTVFEDCRAMTGQEGGGAILAKVGASLYIERSRFIRNRTTNGGGAVAITDRAECIVSESEFIENAAGGGGAVLCAGGTLITTNCTFHTNEANRGGAVFHSGNGSTTIERCIISQNRAVESGGAIQIGGNRDSNSGPVRLMLSIVRSNYAKYGGAISAFGTGDITLERCTVWRNQAVYASIWREGKYTGPYQISDYNIAIKGSILLTSNDIFINARHPVNTAISYSMLNFKPNPPCWGCLFGDPKLTDPINNDFNLLPGSKCIDTGDITILDLDGSRSDMGAIPFGSTWPLSTTNVSLETTPPSFSLSQNAPNPFNPTTHIAFTLPQPGDTKLAVYDITGRHVRTLLKKHLPVGTHTAIWDGTDDSGRRVATGVYIYRVSAEGQSLVRRMTLIR
jgi:hypothetical protein